jgi:sarcosine oxidase
MGAVTDADSVSRRITAADEAEVKEIIRRNLPAGVGPTLAMKTCLYTNSPDGHFIVDRVGERATVACGFSGHGFKFAPAIGEVLADLAVRGQSGLPAGFLGLGRFTF